jgi:hypothetical protein
MTGVGAVAHSINAGLRGRRHVTVGVESHGVVGQPHPRGGVACVLGQVDAPDETGEAVGDRHHARTEQATSVEPTGAVVEAVDRLRRHRVTGRPPSEIDSDER